MVRGTATVRHVRFTRKNGVKALYVLACCGFLAAILCDLSAKRHFSASAVGVARSVALGEPEQASARQGADAALHTGSGLALAGLFAAGLGVASWAVSMVQAVRLGKRLTPVIPLILLIAHAMLHLVTV